MVNGFGTCKFFLVCTSKIPLNVSSDLTRFIKQRIVFLSGRYRKGFVAHGQAPSLRRSRTPVPTLKPQQGKKIFELANTLHIFVSKPVR